MTKEEAIKQLKDNRVLCINSETEPFAIAYDMAIKALEKEPKTGHWIYSKETARYKEHWTCSCCKHDIIENPKYKNWITGESLDFIFCPMCGAKMVEPRESEDNEE